MTVRHYIILAAVLVAATVVAVLMRDPNGSVADQPVHSDPTGMSDEPGAPSKENANPGVKESIEHLRQVLGSRPEDVTALFELARLLQDSHNPEEALTYYERGLRLRPEDNDARIDYSLCLFTTGRINQSLAENRMVLNLESGNLKALYNIGAIHANTGNLDSAEQYWSRIVTLDPEDDLAEQARTNIKKLHDPSTSR
jgi:tetratricopeptide (TPR) repeat protein